MGTSFYNYLQRATCCGLVAATLIGVAVFESTFAGAQQPAAQPGQHTVVLLAEMTGDPAVDSHLRVATDAVVQRLRARGYELAPPAAVGAAMQRGIQDPNTLRTTVGAEIAVRINVRYRDRDRLVIHVGVLSGAGERGNDVTATPPEIDAAVPAAVDGILPAPGTAVAPPVPTAPPTASGAPSGPVLDRVVLKDGTVIEGRVVHQQPGSFVIVQGTDGRQRTISWDRVSEVFAQPPPQQQPPGLASAGPARPFGPPPSQVPAPTQATWDKRGGSVFTFDLQGQIVGTLQRVQTTVNKTFTSGEQMQFSGSSDAGGGGGGVGLHFGYLYLHPPQIDKGTTWAGFRLGTGLDFAYVAFGHRTDANIQAGLRDSEGKMIIPGSAEGGSTEWTSSRIIMIPFSLGGQLGVGKFWGDSRWNGVMLGLDYRPTYFHSKPSDFKSATDGFNPAGFQLTIDIGSLEATSKPEANFRMSVFLLPPVGDRPTFLTLGFGAVWY